MLAVVVGPLWQPFVQAHACWTLQRLCITLLDAELCVGHVVACLEQISRFVQVESRQVSMAAISGLASVLDAVRPQQCSCKAVLDLMATRILPQFAVGCGARVLASYALTLSCAGL